jgi:hypothetical protein
VTPCGSCKNRRFGGTYRLHHQGERNHRASNNVSNNCQLNYTVKKYIVPHSLILFILMMEAICLSETSVLTRATWRNIPEDGILHSLRRENLQCYVTLQLHASLTRLFGVQVSLTVAEHMECLSQSLSLLSVRMVETL